MLMYRRKNLHYVFLLKFDVCFIKNIFTKIGKIVNQSEWAVLAWLGLPRNVVMRRPCAKGVIV